MIIKYMGPTNPKDTGSEEPRTFNLAKYRKYRVVRFFPNIGVVRILDESGQVINLGRKLWVEVKE